MHLLAERLDVWSSIYMDVKNIEDTIYSKEMYICTYIMYKYVSIYMCVYENMYVCVFACVFNIHIYFTYLFIVMHWYIYFLCVYHVYRKVKGRFFQLHSCCVLHFSAGCCSAILAAGRPQTAENSEMIPKTSKPFPPEVQVAAPAHSSSHLAALALAWHGYMV